MECTTGSETIPTLEPDSPERKCRDRKERGSVFLRQSGPLYKMNPTCSSARLAAARHEGMACRMRLTLPLSLVPMLLFAALSPGTYARDPNPTSHPCLARPGWWLGPDGSRLFRVAETGTAIVRGGLPPTPCGVVPLQGLAIAGLPCDSDQ